MALPAQEKSPDSVDFRLENLLSQLTLEEKVSLLAGADMWHTVSVPRLGIPAIRLTDGPNGARGTGAIPGLTSVCFPVGTALAATWNPDLLEAVGRALAEEAKSKGAHILLAPTVNMQRSPLAGRNFECYSEDPYLAGTLATAYIRGLQSRGVGACIKHFVCNESEFERNSMSSEVAERPLHEIYLTPFRMAVRDAKPWAVMSSYNRINGIHAGENRTILLDILKGDWGFDGIVVSDWYGTYSPRVAQGGLDLEMPGPARWMGEQVLAAVRAGEVSETLIDDKVRRLLRTIERAGAFAQPHVQPEIALDKPDHRRVARLAAGEAIVLLQNQASLLPLDPKKLSTIAVIGENAARAQIQGGGSSGVSPQYVVSPLAGIEARVGGEVRVEYALGCTSHKMIPLADGQWLRTADGRMPGLTVDYFDNRDLAGTPVQTEVAQHAQLIWFGTIAAHIDPDNFSVRLSGTLSVPQTGAYTLSLAGVGRARLFLDDVETIDTQEAAGDPTQFAAIVESQAVVDLVAGRPARLRIEYASASHAQWRTLRFGCLPTLPADPIAAAVELAARADVAVVVAGLTNEWESEDFNRIDMHLPGDQNELIARVAAANPHTIVVLNSGSPVSMPWIDRVSAVLQAWYGGQEAGHAIADVLFGDANPSGRLPQTYPRRVQDNPAYLNFPGENGQLLYGEGLFVGYRYYDKKEIEPLFPFGHGLSYTTFAYRNLQLGAASVVPGEPVRVSVEVQNTGTRPGQEVVQLYVRDPVASLVRPEKELKAFAKIALAPGESRSVHFTLNEDAFSFYSPAHKRWVAEAGTFEILIGRSAADIRLASTFELQADPAPAPSEHVLASL